MNGPDRRYLAWGVGFAIVAALPLIAGFTTVGWETSEILGLLATLACLALCSCPVRPRESKPPALLSLRRHEVLGWVALGTAVAHVLGAVLSESPVIEYLKPTSPLYQLAGIAALVALLFLVASSSAGARRRFWRSHRNFQATHIIVGCLMLAVLGVHVVITGRYAGSHGGRILLIAVAAGGIAMLLRRRRSTPGVAHLISALREIGVPRATGVPHETAKHRFAFGRHSTLIVTVILVTMLALGTLLVGRAGVVLREPLLPRTQTLPLDFDHAKHAAVNCLVCHHNYADGRGFEACIRCHRSERADLKVGVEARFHSFCLDCHRNPAPGLVGHGPVSGCVSCHRAPTALR